MSDIIEKKDLSATFLQKTWKWLSIILAAEFSLLVINALLALIYKNYSWNLDFNIHFSSILLAGVTLVFLRAFNQNLDKKIPWSNNIGQRLVAQLIGNIAITLFFTIVIRNGFRVLNFPNTDQLGFIRLQDEIIISSVVSFFTLMVVLVDLGIFLLVQWKKSATEAERFKQENLEFRFDRLKNQVNPHFLFNSLNTLASLVYNDPETASSFIIQMAKVYRYVLENRDKEMITLSEELNFMEAYLFLVKIRFEDGIKFELKISTDSNNLCLPPMTLQLLIENALKHNIVSISKPLLIQIFAGEKVMTVKNNLQPKLSPEPGTKTGLQNIKSRYVFITQRLVSIVKTETEFIVQIPLLEPVV